MTGILSLGRRGFKKIKKKSKLGGQERRVGCQF